MNWVIEKFSKSCNELIIALEQNNISYVLYDSKNVTQMFEMVPTIFHGTLNGLLYCKKYLGNNLIGFNEKQLSCTYYYSYLGKYLFNSDYVMVTAAELKRNRWLYYYLCGKDTKIFVRPNSPNKPFTGILLDLQDLDKFEVEPTELLIVSSPKEVVGEWRFVCSNRGQIIAKSTYLYQGNITIIPFAPIEAEGVALDVISDIVMEDRLFCVDICQDRLGKYALMELNSFSCGDLYAADKDKIVKYIQQI